MPGSILPSGHKLIYQPKVVANQQLSSPVKHLEMGSLRIKKMNVSGEYGMFSSEFLSFFDRDHGGHFPM